MQIAELFKNTIFVFENAGLIVCYLIIIFPLKHFLHLIFFLIHFILDLYFQNYIFFEDYIILTHFIPLFIFLYLKFEKKSEFKKTINLDKVLILIISIAYFSNSLVKISSGWYDLNTTVIYDYIFLFNKGYQLNFHFSTFFLSIQNHFFYKSLDYLVVIFQFSAIFLFFKYSYFKSFSLIATIFHIGVLCFMEIPIFYTYILLYSLIILEKKQTFKENEKLINSTIPTKSKKWSFKNDTIEKKIFYNLKKDWLKTSILFFIILYTILLVYFKFDKYFILRNSSLQFYIYHNTIFTLLSVSFFIYTWIKKYL